MKITLCGSTRFISSFNEWNLRLTKAGHLVYSVCAVTSGAAEPGSSETKLVLDAVHIAKIEESDAIFVITMPHEVFNDHPVEWPNPYIGESTAREIYYADLRDKVVIYDHSMRRTNGQGHSVEISAPLDQELTRVLMLSGRGPKKEAQLL